MNMANVSGPSAPAIHDFGPRTPVGVRDLDPLTREQPPARDASKKVTAAEELGQRKHGIGLATDHTGQLTGVEGKRFDSDLRPPLLHLRIERNSGFITPEQPRRSDRQGSSAPISFRWEACGHLLMKTVKASNDEEE
jgi:hypothetical protein